MHLLRTQVERMGIGYEDLKRVNERIIYVSISGFGKTGT
jgi:formyl-CoA transferase